MCLLCWPTVRNQLERRERSLLTPRVYHQSPRILRANRPGQVKAKAKGSLDAYLDLLLGSLSNWVAEDS